jgi:hypothetical protein
MQPAFVAVGSTTSMLVTDTLCKHILTLHINALYALLQLLKKLLR